MSSHEQPTPAPPPQWVIDLHEPRPIRSKPSGIPDPPGFTPSSTSSKRSATANKKAARTRPSTEETDTLKLKKAWEVALAPAKQLPMNAIMMYMSGNTLQIFSIMMVWMLFTNPIKGIFGTEQAFTRYETEGTKGRLWGVKVVYVLMQLLALGLGLWKVNSMGLLPNTRSDWLAWETSREPTEQAIFAL
ncbi:MAG: hypothetical protein M1823_000111 [Watsoniomyces obsoletus]|nr:MAG: hypothetical protein M1823_000111 [Watsoniomyces obsoletus]